MGSGKIHNGWRKNPPLLAKILALAENSVLWFVTIFLENSAAGRLWSCGTPSLAWNYLESFLQCIMMFRMGRCVITTRNIQPMEVGPPSYDV
jgi:hypothetical protein